MEEKKLTDEEIVKALEYEKEHLLREEKLTGNAYNTQSVYMRGEGVLAILNLIHRLQAEIERLIDEKWKVQDDLDCYHEMNGELQKQVDELKAENTELYKEHTTLIAGSILKKEDIVKDTAKEIYKELRKVFDTTFLIGDLYVLGIDIWTRINGKIKEIVKNKGVEVE